MFDFSKLHHILIARSIEKHFSRVRKVPLQPHSYSINSFLPTSASVVSILKYHTSITSNLKRADKDFDYLLHEPKQELENLSAAPNERLDRKLHLYMSLSVF